MPWGIALFIVFFVLKLGVGDTVVENWSWWWVAAPIWIPAAIIAVFQLLAILFVRKATK
ncbi:hypothetical protein PBI_BOGOSYJAY_70 [Mycobacterium phage BogosyJay]|nr:membrane protein [Mycobacterium phage Maminiaina]QFG14977.1 hypothetical protein PBI_BOGOSYJAY_70 [Mycobacterium phage BogosyJay]QGH78071.1 hypothetical protein SEA_LONEWOLF_70 [Mycobacterium phage LoneWolf]QGJ90211.1 membrane protein [Mycobacterium phage SheaKeira]